MIYFTILTTILCFFSFLLESENQSQSSCRLGPFSYRGHEVVLVNLELLRGYQ